MDRWKRSDISDVDVCRATVQFQDREHGECVFIDAILAKNFPGCPENVIYSAMERAEGRRLIEYGTSLRTSWLTETGIALLQQWAGSLSS